MVQNVLLVLRYAHIYSILTLYLMTGNVIQFQNEKSTRILSIDGNFGLCRKKAAGQSVRPPLHNGIFFEPQEQVDSFVQAYKMPKSTGKKVQGILMHAIQQIVMHAYIVHVGMQ